MQLCKTCKYWSLNKSYFGEVPGSGKCLRVPEFWQASVWSKNFEGRTLKEEYADRLAFAADGSDYYAALLTMPNFGCVQHSPI